MDCLLYVRILEEFLLPFLIENVSDAQYRFMQDNSPKHTNRVAKDFYAQRKINWWKTPQAMRTLTQLSGYGENWSMLHIHQSHLQCSAIDCGQWRRHHRRMIHFIVYTKLQRTIGFWLRGDGVLVGLCTSGDGDRWLWCWGMFVISSKAALVSALLEAAASVCDSVKDFTGEPDRSHSSSNCFCAAFWRSPVFHSAGLRSFGFLRATFRSFVLLCAARWRMLTRMGVLVYSWVPWNEHDHVQRSMGGHLEKSFREEVNAALAT